MREDKFSNRKETVLNWCDKLGLNLFIIYAAVRQKEKLSKCKTGDKTKEKM